MFKHSIYLMIAGLMAATISSGASAQTATSSSLTVGSSTPTLTQSSTTNSNNGVVSETAGMNAKSVVNTAIAPTPPAPLTIPAPPTIPTPPTPPALPTPPTPPTPPTTPTPPVIQSNPPLLLQSVPLPSNIKIAPVNLLNGATFNGYTIVK